MPHTVSVDPNSEWYPGVLGFFTRIRGIVSAVGTKVLASITAASLGYIEIGVAFALLAGGVAWWLTWLRIVMLGRTKSEEKFHDFCHSSRDNLAAIIASNDPTEYRGLIDKFNQDAAEYVAGFFRIRCHDDSINCAIRLAGSNREQNKEVYSTRARSRGMCPARADKTEAVGSDEGLPRAMLNRDTHGVYLLPSIDEAVKENVWKRTHNDSYNDVKCLMASPINGWRDKHKFMLGILYVTSGKPGRTWSGSERFRNTDSLPIKAFADALGSFYAVIWDKVAGI